MAVKKSNKTKKVKKTKKKPIKKIKKPANKKESRQKEKLIGKIIHYFSKIKVAVIKLKAPLKKDDRIRIAGGEDTNFTQAVKSIEINHKKIKEAKKGSEIGFKVKKKVREGYKVYKI